MRQTLSTLSVILFFVAKTSIFSIVEKLNISAIHISIILMFSVNLPLVFIYKFDPKEIKPREQQLVIVRQGTYTLKFNVRNHRNFGKKVIEIQPPGEP